MTDFYRIKRLPPYVLAEVTRLKLARRAAGHDIIDFGMGNPDGATPPHIVSKLVEVVSDPRTHRYSTSRGIPGLRRAQAAYYQRRFGVTLDPESEIIVTLGSKEGLASLAQAISAPGDLVLVPNPCYPIHAYAFIMAGASVRHLPFQEHLGDFIEMLDHNVRHSVPKPLALVVSFPANPTTQVVDLDFYQRVVDYCRANQLWLISDLAYTELYFDPSSPPPSALQIEGAKEITVEFTTLSKTYNMAGWRVGFAAGNKTLLNALARVKSYLDYGAFTPIQVAATAALNGDQTCVATIRNEYKERRDVLVDGLCQLGWMVDKPSATMFVWAPIPPQYRQLGSLAFANLLLEQADVAVAPGIGFGEYGDGHVRFALVENPQRIRQALRSLKKLFPVVKA
jgi:alanine-synthesizing transaminase